MWNRCWLFLFKKTISCKLNFKTVASGRHKIPTHDTGGFSIRFIISELAAPYSIYIRFYGASCCLPIPKSHSRLSFHISSYKFLSSIVFRMTTLSWSFLPSFLCWNPRKHLFWQPFSSPTMNIFFVSVSSIILLELNRFFVQLLHLLA
jgi:hypothetical protein